MHASIKNTIVAILTATVLAVATIGGVTTASADQFHRGFGGHGFGGRGFAGGYGGYGGYRGYGGYGNWGPGYALGLGLLGGAIIGSQYPYYDSGYGYGAGYDSYPQDRGGDYSAYCANTFRSYDPASGTYLGYDGFRHPCA